MKSIPNKFDSQNLYQIISEAPKQLLQAFRETRFSIPQDSRKIVFCGMGGSASPADLLRTFLRNCEKKNDLVIESNRDYTFPNNIDSSWVGIFCSYSGNTEETVSALKLAAKYHLKDIIVIAHGKDLEKIAKARKYKFIQVPDTKQPRMSYCYILGALLKLLANSKIIALNEKALTNDVNLIIKNEKNIIKLGQSIAKKLQGFVPIVYTSERWRALSGIWKINFNENAKIPSFYNVFPELNHNEIVGFTNSIGKYQIIVLVDPAEHPRILKRIKITESLLKNKIKFQIIRLPGKSAFSKMLFTIMLGLYASYFLAINYKIDPTPVKIVEKLKVLMTK